MALTRKFLTALGIEESKIDEIITAHTDVTSVLKKERDDFRDKAETLEEAQKKLGEDKKDLEKQLNDAKKELEKFSDEDTWQKKYEQLDEDNKKLQKDFDDYKKEVGDKEVATKKKDAYKKMLKEAGISEKRIDSVMRVSDIDSVEFDNDNNIKDSEKLIEKIKEEWADFITKTSEQGANTATPPANNSESAMTKEEIMAIKDRSERQKAIAENPKLFGIE